MQEPVQDSRHRLNPMDTTHDAHLSFLRGVLISLVTLGHVIQWFSYPAYQGEYLRDPLFSGIYLFHVPLFFAVSGYLVGLRARSPEPWNQLPRRLLRLAIPSLSWFVLTLSCLALVKLAQRGVSSLSTPSPELLLYSLGMHAWYVWCLCFFLIINTILSTTGPLRLPLLFLSSLACLWLPESGILFLLQYALPFLCLGFAVSTNKGLRLRFLPWFLKLPLFLLSTWIVWKWTPADSVYVQGWSLASHSWQNVLPRFLQQLLVVILAADLLLSLSKQRRLSFFAYIGDRTLMIYLSQNLIILTFVPIINQRPLAGLQHSLFVAPLLTTAILSLCLGLERLLSKNRALSYLLNGKSVESSARR